MGMYTERKRPHGRARAPQHGRGRTFGPANATLASLQQQADRSQPVSTLMALQRAEVDRTSITHNDRVDLKPTPRKNRDGTSSDPADGVKLWAVHEYLMGPVTVMCSMVGGQIGSIYFDGGRVRTTHSFGPTTSKHHKDRLFQYNIDREAAFQEFAHDAQAEYARLYPDDHPTRRLNRWIKYRLKGEDADGVPTWAYPIESIDDALEETDDVDDEGLKLFEVMVHRDGRLGSHPSRGAGVKSTVQITRAQLAMLKKAGRQFADKDNPRFANQLFYNYVAKSLPQLLPYIRKPEDIRY